MLRTHRIHAGADPAIEDRPLGQVVSPCVPTPKGASPEKASLTRPVEVFEWDVFLWEPNPAIRDPYKSAEGAQSSAQGPGASLATGQANRPCAGWQKEL